MREKRFWLIGAILFSELGSSIFSFVLSLAVLNKTNRAASYSTILVVSSVTSILATPLIGNVVDKFPKRRLLVVSQGMSVISLIIFALFLRVGGAVSVWSVSVLTIFLDLSDIIYGTTLMTSAVYMVTDENELVTFNGLQQSVSSLCGLLGPLLAGAVYSWVKLPAFLFFEVFCELLAIGCFFKLPYHQQSVLPVNSEATVTTATIQQQHSFKQAVRYLWQTKVVLLLTIGMFVINFFMVSLSVGLPFVIFKKLAGNSFAIGAIEVAMPIGMILASLLIPLLRAYQHELRYIVGNWAICGLMITGIALTLKTLKQSSSLFIVVTFLISLVIGIVLATGKIPLVTYMQKRIVPQQQGKIFSILDTLVQVAIPIGTALYGLMFDHYSAVIIFAGSGLTILLFVFSLIPQFKTESTKKF